MDPITAPLYVPAQDSLANQQVDHVKGSLGRAEGMDRESIHRAGKEFEGYFISYLLKVMRETVPKGFLNNKYGDQFLSFYDQELGRIAAEGGGIGLGRFIEEHLQRNAPAVEEKTP